MNDSKESAASESATRESGVAISKATSQTATSNTTTSDMTKPDIPQTPQGESASGYTGATASGATMTEADSARTARNWAVAAHLSGLSLYLGIPFGNILGPLIIWLIKKDESPYAEAQAKEALNFQISLTIYGVIAGFMVFLLIGLFLLPVLFVLHIVLTIVATIRVSEGKAYRYPLTIRLIS